MFRLDSKVAIVTGASSGLGEAIAVALHAAGATLLLTARRRTELELVTSRLDGAAAVVGDLTDPQLREELVRRAVEGHGRVDVLVNNAGTAHGGIALEEDEHSFRSQIDINLVAAYELSRLAAGHMVRTGGGAVVNVASLAALRSFDRYPLAGYRASKAGLAGLTAELAAQWGQHGIRVNAVAPGWFPTRMTGDLADPEQRAWVESHTALGRPGDPGELASVVLFLASDAASYVTGQVLPVDGGWTAY